MKTYFHHFSTCLEAIGGKIGKTVLGIPTLDKKKKNAEKIKKSVRGNQHEREEGGNRSVSRVCEGVA